VGHGGIPAGKTAVSDLGFQGEATHIARSGRILGALPVMAISIHSYTFKISVSLEGAELVLEELADGNFSA